MFLSRVAEMGEELKVELLWRVEVVWASGDDATYRLQKEMNDAALLPPAGQTDGNPEPDCLTCCTVGLRATQLQSSVSDAHTAELTINQPPPVTKKRYRFIH